MQSVGKISIEILYFPVTPVVLQQSWSSKAQDIVVAPHSGSERGEGGQGGFKKTTTEGECSNVFLMVGDCIIMCMSKCRYELMQRGMAIYCIYD